MKSAVPKRSENEFYNTETDVCPGTKWISQHQRINLGSCIFEYGKL